MADFEKSDEQSFCQYKNSDGSIGRIALNCFGVAIIEEFNQIYRNRLDYIDRATGCNNVELKYPIYQQWVEQLTEQIRTLIEIVIEIENETNNRVNLLESRLRKDYQQFNTEKRKNILEKDIKNLLELIRRLRVDRKWKVDDLTFNSITYQDILGNNTNEFFDNTSIMSRKIESVPDSGISTDSELTKLRNEISEKDEMIESLNHEKTIFSKENLQLKAKLDKMEKLIRQLEKKSLSVRALAVEVAAKHDIILNQRNEVVRLDALLRKADMQTHFKDDVIRELRRELKHHNDKHEGFSTNQVISISAPINMSINTECSLNNNSNTSLQTLDLLQKTECEIINNLRVELDLLRTQIRAREGHISHQCSMIADYQKKLNDLRTERDFLIQRACVKNADKQTSMDCFEVSNNCNVKLDEEDGDNLISEGKFMPNDKIMSNLKENITDKEKIIDKLNNELRSVKNNLLAMEEECKSYSIEIDKLRKENQTNLDNISNLNSIKAHLESEIKNIIKLKNYRTEKRSDTNELAPSSYIETENLLSEEKRRLEIECKNQLTTISNLREALESAKRGKVAGDMGGVHNQMTSEQILMEHIRDLNADNLKSENVINLLRNENLKLKNDIIEMDLDYKFLEDRYNKCNHLNYNKIPESCHLTAIHEDLQKLNTQSEEIYCKLSNRNDAIKIAKLIRKDYHEMEKKFTVKFDMQNDHYTKIIQELSEDLSSLNEQLVASQQESLRQENLMKGTTALEDSITKMENHNDLLQQQIKSYEARLIETEFQLKESVSQNINYETLIDKLKCEINGKDKQINDLKIQIEKHKTSPTKSNNNNIVNSPRPRLPPNQSPRNSESIRLNDINKKLNLELQHVRKKATDESNRFINENTELQVQIGNLKGRIAGLEITVDKKEIEIERLNSFIDDAKRREADLREELYLKSSRYSTGSPTTDSQKELQRREHKLVLDLQIAKKTIEEQSESLIKNQDNNKLLLSENEQILRKVDELNKENIILKNDLFSIKEALAILDGRNGALSDLLQTTQNELTRDREELNHLRGIEIQLKTTRENYKKMLEHNSEMIKKLQNLHVNYDSLKEEYKVLLDVKEQALVALNTARKWQTESSEREKLLNLKTMKHKDHIKTLLDDRKTLVSKLNEMHRDELILRNELDRLREILYEFQCHKTDSSMRSSGRSYSFSRDGYGYHRHQNAIERYASDTELSDNGDPVLQKVKHVTRKIYRTRKYWQDGIRAAIK